MFSRLPELANLIGLVIVSNRLSDVHLVVFSLDFF